MIQLTEKEFQKLSDITCVPHHDLQKLYAMGLLNEAVTLDAIIRRDFDEIRKIDKYRPGQIITRLASYYACSKGKVLSAIYRKAQRQYYCEQCGKRVSRATHTRNDGLCDDCVAQSIEI